MCVTSRHGAAVAVSVIYDSCKFVFLKMAFIENLLSIQVMYNE